MPSLHRAALASIDETYLGGCALFTAGVLDDLASVASLLPTSLTWGGFECRLDSDDARVDFGVSVERASADELLDTAIDAFCPRMLRNWLDLDPALRRLCPRATIEFDRPLGANASATRPSPWQTAFAFFRVAPVDAGDLPQALSVLLAALTQRGSAEAVSATAIEEALPRGSQILHVAALEHRGECETRLHFAIRPDYIRSICTAIAAARPSAAELLMELSASLSIDRIAVQASNVTGAFQPYSVEFIFGNDSSATGKWKELLHRLVAARIASQDKVDALLLWPGRTTYVDPAESARVQVSRGINVTLRLGELPSAKAYPYFHCRYIE
jgi:hypothetical protein